MEVLTGSVPPEDSLLDSGGSLAVLVLALRWHWSDLHVMAFSHVYSVYSHFRFYQSL